MMLGLVYSPNRRMLNAVCRLLDECAVEHGVSVRLIGFANKDELKLALNKMEGCAFSCVDIGHGEGMGVVRAIRTVAPHAELMLVVGEGVSPMEYIVPGVMPTGLVQLPASATRVREAAVSFMTYVLRDICEESSTDALLVETRERKMRIPFSNIYCFESKAKRITVRLRREEHGYYDTLDRLQKALPSNFIRCHRSYIVNLDHVSGLVLSEGVVVLDDKTRVPVSRTYRTKIKGAVR